MATSPVAIVAGADTRLGRYITAYLRSEGWLVSSIDPVTSEVGNDPRARTGPGD